ncbi:hypothetical protein JYU34_004391 [Plutella xylostella]|uniref:FLYWCH-type domain-containing protein n=1 Tax=Plutella xylostella TaxID=51655 RepID=A0ABQ7QXU8_PLUXY|nr:hypothetical protein JYU34_004391 [Plutella xylostella]
MTSGRGHNLVIAGYKFSYQRRTAGNKLRWQCSKQSKTGCKAAVHTIGGKIVSCNNCHNHPKPYQQRV